MKPPPPASDTPDRTILGVVLLSLFGYPGSGHFLVKRPWRGGFWAVLFTLAMVASVGTFASNLWHLYKSLTELSEPSDLSLQAWVPCLSAVFWCALTWVLAAVDAALLASRAQIEPIKTE